MLDNWKKRVIMKSVMQHYASICVMLHYLRQDVFVHWSLIKRFLRDHSIGVKAIRTAGSTADWRLAALLIELKAQIL